MDAPAPDQLIRGDKLVRNTGLRHLAALAKSAIGGLCSWNCCSNPIPIQALGFSPNSDQILFRIIHREPFVSESGKRVRIISVSGVVAVACRSSLMSGEKFLFWKKSLILLNSFSHLPKMSFFHFRCKESLKIHNNRNCMAFRMPPSCMPGAEVSFAPPMHATALLIWMRRPSVFLCIMLCYINSMSSCVSFDSQCKSRVNLNNRASLGTLLTFVLWLWLLNLCMWFV